MAGFSSPKFTRLRLSHILLQRSPASACLISYSNVHPPPPFSYPSQRGLPISFVNATSVDKKKITNISKRGGGGAGYTKMKIVELSISQGIRCPFAIWNFALDGNLVKVFLNLKCDLSLRPRCFTASAFFRSPPAYYTSSDLATSSGFLLFRPFSRTASHCIPPAILPPPNNPFTPAILRTRLFSQTCSFDYCCCANAI